MTCPAVSCMGTESSRSSIAFCYSDAYLSMNCGIRAAGRSRCHKGTCEQLRPRSPGSRRMLSGLRHTQTHVIIAAVTTRSLGRLIQAVFRPFATSELLVASRVTVPLLAPTPLVDNAALERWSSSELHLACQINGLPCDKQG